MPLLLLLLLSGCASTAPNQQMRQLSGEVGKLNQQLSKLTVQAAALEKQSRLNQHSRQGAWLIPAAKTPVLLQSQVGDVRLWLSPIIRQNDGSQAILHLSSADHTPLNGLNGQVEWGISGDSSGHTAGAESRSETFQVAPALLPLSETTIRLQLTGLPPEKLGYVRIYGLSLVSASSTVP